MREDVQVALLTTTTQVFSGTGKYFGVRVTPGVAPGTVVVRDGDGSGTIIDSLVIDGATQFDSIGHQLTKPVFCKAGLHVTVTGSGTAAITWYQTP